MRVESGSRRTARVDGPTLFARFAYPPNALDLCGPCEHDELFDYASSGVVDSGLRRLARGFDGAWPYLELIAGAAGIADPLDRRVVEAYWIGNRLSRSVSAADLARDIDDRFRLRTGRDHGSVTAAIARGLAPTHAFHVFAVYPWAGLLRSGRTDPALSVLDQCRVRWGEVLLVPSAGQVIVRSPHLVADGGLLRLDEPRVEAAVVARDGAAMVDGLEPGDLVAMHWDWVCATITAGDVARLRAETDACLATVNALGSAGVLTQG